MISLLVLFLIAGFRCPFYGLFRGGAVVGNFDRISWGGELFEHISSTNYELTESKC